MTTSFDPVPEGYDPKVGEQLIYVPTGHIFTVLCSCPSSKPIEHTRRYIKRNPEQFGKLKTVATPQAASASTGTPAEQAEQAAEEPASDEERRASRREEMLRRHQARREEAEARRKALEAERAERREDPKAYHERRRAELIARREANQAERDARRGRQGLRGNGGERNGNA